MSTLKGEVQRGYGSKLTQGPSVLEKVRLVRAKAQEVWAKYCLMMSRNIGNGVEVFEANGQGLSEDDMWVLKNGFERGDCSKLKQLLLDENLIGDEGLEMLAAGILARSGTCLDLVTLRQNTFGQQNLSHLAECFTRIRHLDISSNSFGDEEGVRILAEGLKKNGVMITKLSLANCGLSDSSMDSLCAAIVENRSLDKVVLDGNVRITDKSLGAVLSIYSPRKIKKVVHLSVNGTGLSQNSLNSISNAMRNARKPFLFTDLPLSPSLAGTWGMHFRVKPLITSIASISPQYGEDFLHARASIGTDAEPSELEVLYFTLYDHFSRRETTQTGQSHLFEFAAKFLHSDPNEFWALVGKLTLRDADLQKKYTIQHDHLESISFQVMATQNQVFRTVQRNAGASHMGTTGVVVVPCEIEQEQLESLLPAESNDVFDFVKLLQAGREVVMYDLHFESYWTNTLFTNLAKDVVPVHGTYVQRNGILTLVILDDEHKVRIQDEILHQSSDFLFLCLEENKKHHDWSLGDESWRAETKSLQMNLGERVITIHAVLYSKGSANAGSVSNESCTSLAEIIIKRMMAHRTDAPIQAKGCLELGNLAVNDNNEVQLMELGAGTALVQAMQNHRDNAEIQSCACGALRNLASNDKNEVQLMELGAGTAIIQAMQNHRDNANVQENACGALSNLTVNDNNKVQLMELGAGPAIVQAMQNHRDNAEVQRYACGSLRNLAMNDNNEEQLMELGAGTAIVQAMQNHRDNANVQENACGALSNLTMNDNNEVQLMEVGVGPAIVQAMQNHRDNAEVQRYACGSLRNLAVNASHQVQLMEVGAGIAIVQAMRNHRDNAEVQRYSCGALENLAVNDKNEVQLMEVGAGTAIVQAMQNHRDNANVQENALGALENLAVNANNKVQLMEVDAGTAIVQAMQNHRDNANVQKYACGALGNLALNPQTKDQLMELGAGTEINHAMRIHLRNRKVQENGRDALETLGVNTNKKRKLR